MKGKKNLGTKFALFKKTHQEVNFIHKKNNVYKIEDQAAIYVQKASSIVALVPICLWPLILEVDQHQPSA